MKLYATTTSERATKGQGGQWLDIEITAEKQDLAIISVREESNNYLISIIANPERKKQEIWIPKGEKQKGENPYYYDLSTKELETYYNSLTNENASKEHIAEVEKEMESRA